MKTQELLKKLEGIQTIKTVMDKLKVNKKKAVFAVYKLRKEGYVKTKYRSDKTRIYSISYENKLGGKSYYEIINENSPLKVSTPHTYKIYGREPSLEETLIFAVKSNDLRLILAALSLFKKINNWTELYHLAKKNFVERKVGALYDLARKIMLTRKMTKKFRNNTLPKDNKYQYFIEGIRSDDYQDIERTWKVYLPFNKKDSEGVYI